MNAKDQWLLPQGIEEVLPREARALEYARRELLDLFARWGYALVMPPFIEYLESLLTGTGNDLDLQTFRITDQVSGRMMGLRADMTPQAARIDAHQLRRDEPSRLCYMGTVLRTRGDEFGSSRSPLQVGAELFGHGGPESDVEILALLLESLALMEISDVHMDLGHVGIFRALAQEAGLDKQTENDLFDALQRKAATEIDEILAASGAALEHTRRLAALSTLNGGREVLDAARRQLGGAGGEVMAALDNLCEIAAQLEQRATDVELFFDLAELRGYRYQTGMVFAVFVPGCGREIARGGRYDAIGKVFGRARPATGFSTDLKVLLELGGREFPGPGSAIFAPADTDPALSVMVRKLRQQGETVICELPGQAGDAAAMGCDRCLLAAKGEWKVVPV